MNKSKLKHIVYFFRQLNTGGLHQVFFSVVLLSLLMFPLGCNRSDAPDVSEVEVKFGVIPFYRDLFSVPPDSVEKHLPRLIDKYGSYFHAYSQGVINIGSSEETGFADRLASFLAYEPNAEVLDTCRKVFSDTRALKEELTSAFKYYQYYFPEREVPDVYLHISGFNQSVVVDSGWVSVSVEKYLGAECPFYEWLEIPLYLRGRMNPQQVVPDVVRAIGITEFSTEHSTNDLIAQMVYHGKILHFVEHLIPGISGPRLFGYTSAEYEWSLKHEELMWETIVEKKHLFATDPTIVRKYVDEAPFTNFFGQESPGRAGRFIGYRLLESWLNRHPDKNLRDLMNLTDAHQVLARAGYRP